MIIAQNTWDLKSLDAQGFSGDPELLGSYKTVWQTFYEGGDGSFNYELIDTNEMVDPKDKNIQNPDVFSYKAVISATDGTASLEKLESGGLLSFLNPNQYYRYKFKFGTIFVTFLGASVAMFFTGIKVVRLIFELMAHQVITPVVALAELHNGQRTKALLQSIISTFATIIICFVLMRLYLIGTAWLSGSPINGFGWFVAFIGMTLSLLDGPDFIARIFGYDAGIKSAFSTFMVARTIGRFVSRPFAMAAHHIPNPVGERAQGARSARTNHYAEQYRERNYENKSTGDVAATPNTNTANNRSISDGSAGTPPVNNSRSISTAAMHSTNNTGGSIVNNQANIQNKTLHNIEAPQGVNTPAIGEPPINMQDNTTPKTGESPVNAGHPSERGRLVNPQNGRAPSPANSRTVNDVVSQINKPQGTVQKPPVANNRSASGGIPSPDRNPGANRYNESGNTKKGKKKNKKF